MNNLKDLLEYLKSQTQAGRDSQELQEMEDLRQAEINAKENYSQSPARFDLENRQAVKDVAALNEILYGKKRELEAKDRAEAAAADKLFFEQKDAEVFKKLKNAINKNR
jgi:hypothetical protein